MTDADIISDCQEFIRTVLDAEGDNRQSAIQALKFGAGDQWPNDIKAARDLQKRPCLTINKTDSLIRQVTNNLRQQRPRMIVHPVGNGADQEIADVIKGLLKHIEAHSMADAAYDTATDFQVRMGWGYARVGTQYVSETSFDQEICLEQVDNPFTVYFDPYSTAPDGSDAERVVVTDTMRKEAFKKKYPGKADSGSFQALGAGDSGFLWSTKDDIRIAEFWRVEMVPDTLQVLSNGWTGFKGQVDQDVVKSLQLTVINERPSYRRRVMFYKLTAFDVLEKREWRGRWIPIVPFWGSKVNIGGRTERFGMIKNLMDPARMYNFWRTSEAELVALAPKAPWLIAEGQDEGYEDEWRDANQLPYSRLKYKPKSFDDGTPVPPPQRQAPQQIPAANVNAAIGASEDMKAVAGIFDPSLGNREKDPSGKALRGHQQQSDVSNFHFYDNACRSLRFIGKICLDLIPTIYDTERVIRIIGDDGEPSTVTINEKKRDQVGAIQKVLNDVTVGQYDVVIDTGPGYNTKRQESADGMLQLLGTPLGEKIASIADDVVIRALDFTGARELADRLAAANPIAQQEMSEDLPEQAKQIVMQARQQVQQLQQALQQLMMEKKAKVWGDAEWIAFERWKIAQQQQEETKRVLIKEHGEDSRELVRQHAETQRTTMRDTTKMYDTDTRAATDRFEAVLDAKTDLELGKDRGPKNEPGN